LDQDDVLAVAVAEVAFGDIQLLWGVFCDDLELVAIRHADQVGHRLVDDLAQGLAIFYRLAADQIDANEPHRLAPPYIGRRGHVRRVICRHRQRYGERGAAARRLSVPSGSLHCSGRGHTSAPIGSITTCRRSPAWSPQRLRSSPSPPSPRNRQTISSRRPAIAAGSMSTPWWSTRR